MILTILVVAFTVVIIWYVLKTRQEIKEWPPGPFPLPIIGNIYNMFIPKVIERKIIPIALGELTKKYGPITRFDFGLSRMIILDDYQLLKDILGSEHWAARHFDEWFGERSFGKPYGLLFSSGEEWKEMRRFTLRTLRDFGFGKFSSQEAIAEEELTELTKRLNQNLEENGKIVKMYQFFTISVLNIIWGLVTGVRFSHDDPKLRKFNKTTYNVVKAAALGDNLSNAFPIIRHFYTPFLKPKIIEMQDYFRELLNKKRQAGTYKEEPKDFIEVFLKEMDNNLNNNPNYYSEEQFIVLLLDLFMAGSETTSNTLEFAILYMILNPDIQTKVQSEIDQIIGPTRFPTAVDKLSMPYTRATILEIQRISNVVPVDSRTSTETTKVGSYVIPKGTDAIINLYGMHMNPKIWEEPNEFRPERFLDSENNIINANKIMPFGFGKRVCIGEPMASFTLFVFFTALLQKYTFSQDPGKPIRKVQPINGVTMSPKPFSVKISHRVY